MYRKRLLIFISLCAAAVVVCFLRLSCMSLESQNALKRIEELRILPSKQTPTVRGDIYDRKGNILAKDEPQFYIGISYDLTKILDDRYIEAALEKLKSKDSDKTAEQIEQEFFDEIQQERAVIRKVIEIGAEIKDVSPEQIEKQIEETNDRFWQMREFFAWYWNYPKSQLRLDCEKRKVSIPISSAVKDYRNVQCTDESERRKEILKVDLKEMHQPQPLIELDDEQKDTVQIEFMDVPGVNVTLQTKRHYRYGSAASQIVGWVGRVEPAKDETFSKDKYSRYLAGEVAGKFGVELMCEPVLRGQRGTVTFTRSGELITDLQADPEFGRDVTLTIDIELQRQIEEYLLSDKNSNASAPMGAVVIDVNSDEILAMVSLPNFDLNTARNNYGNLLMAKNRPLESKAMVKTYPPGSSIKPVILIIGLEEHMVAPNDIISCPCQYAPKGWPNCLIVNRSHALSCHDAKWENEGGNIGRNAIRGSCNVYFSRLANRFESEVFQNWLYDFGYGRKILARPNFDFKLDQLDRSDIEIGSLRESAGQISSKIPASAPNSFADITELEPYEKKFFGMGEGGFRATVLQVANAMATIARGGIFEYPKLFADEFEDRNESEELTIKKSTLDVIRDGMHAVVYEREGTAYSAFKDADFDVRDMTLYGKTGSTEGVATAWFAAFAEDGIGRSVAIAIVVEGGSSGSRHAAPLGRRILELCNEAGYIGKDIAGNYGNEE